jgi:hypothetical protein
VKEGHDNRTHSVLKRINSADLARLARQADPPWVLGIRAQWRIRTADQFSQDPEKTPCWTGSIAELLDELLRHIERRPNLPFLQKTPMPNAVRQALADRGRAVGADGRLIRLAKPPTPKEPPPPPAPDDPLDGLLDHAAEVLRAIPQVILQGPPGTGKTYTAKRLAARLLKIGASAVDEEEHQTTGEFHAARFSAEKAHPVVPGSSTYRGGGRNLKRGWVSSFRVP